jgi:hypothetical protein
VKRRKDGRGDGWAAAHRLLHEDRNAKGIKRIGFHMEDIDQMFGSETAFSVNCADRLFCEYQPLDGHENRYKIIRDHALVALFDRKLTAAAAAHADNYLSLSLYLKICRLGDVQLRAPRFFFCIGGHDPPWILSERNIWTGEKCGRDVIIETREGAHWRRIWDEIGLTDQRLDLRGSLRG